jgi:hypothetical protein
VADLAADAKPDALDGLREDAELLARRTLERGKKEVRADAMPDILSLAGRFAHADVEMWGTARDMAERVPGAELVARRIDTVESFDKLRDALVADAKELVGKFKISGGDGNVLVEAEDKIVRTGSNDVLTVNFADPVQRGNGDTIQAKYAVSMPGDKPVLKVHQPEPGKKQNAVFEDIEFDDALIAKLMANIGANAMTSADPGC